MSDREDLRRFIAPMLLGSCALPAASDSRWVLEVKRDGIQFGCASTAADSPSGRVPVAT